MGAQGFSWGKDLKGTWLQEETMNNNAVILCSLSHSVLIITIPRARPDGRDVVDKVRVHFVVDKVRQYPEQTAIGSRLAVLELTRIPAVWGPR